MGFINKGLFSIVKIKVSENDFDLMHFEPISNNDYWSFKSVENQKRYINSNVKKSEMIKSPSMILYQNQSSESLSKIFGSPNFPKYKNYIYDIWVVEYKNINFIIRQSYEGTLYDVHIPEVNGEVNTLIHSDYNLGIKIEEFMNEVLKIYT